MDQGAIITVTCSMKKTTLTAFNQLLPGLTPEGVLKIGHTLKVTVTKQLPIDGVVGNSERSLLIPVGDMDDFHSIRD